MYYEQPHIKISKKALERIVFLLVIIILLLVIFIPRMMKCPDCEKECLKILASNESVSAGLGEVTGDVVLDPEVVEVTEMTTETTIEEVDIEEILAKQKEELQKQFDEQLAREKEELQKKIDEIENKQTTTTETTQVQLSGKIDMKIEDVDYEIKSDDYAKVIRLKIKIDNQKRDITPKLLVYLYDDDDDPILRNYPSKNINLDPMIPGDVFEDFVVMGEHGIGFNEITKRKTLKVVLRDALTNDVLDTEVKVLTLSV